jgi:hypothetical protein
MRIAVVVAVTVSVVVSFHDVTVFVSFQDVTVWYLVTNMIPEEGVTGMTVNKPESLSGSSMVVEALGAAAAACVICGSAVVWWMDVV